MNLDRKNKIINIKYNIVIHENINCVLKCQMYQTQTVKKY